ncbi:MAG: hypothetical protein ACI9MC_001896 [Kiritimatiellia bacterium]|jgi:hypothetical protein
MAIRVKKLARELRCSPERVLGLLHFLGFDRYKSFMDMVADRPAAKVRQAHARGEVVTPFSPSGSAVTAKKKRTASAPAPKREVMPQMVGGQAEHGPLDVSVEDLGADRAPERSRQLDARAEEALRRAASLETEYQVRVRELAERESQLKSELDALKQDLDRKRQELDEALVQLSAREQAVAALESGGVPLVDLLAERGLRGRDEASRALAQLSAQRLLDGTLLSLRVFDPAAVRDILRSRLILAKGPLELDGVAVVTVAPDRAELPAGDALQRLKDALADQFLLSGLTRVVVVGGGPLWHRMLRGGLDPRVQLRLDPSSVRDVDAAVVDVDWADVVVLWGVTETDSALRTYSASDAVMVRLKDGGLLGLLSHVQSALSTG